MPPLLMAGLLYLGIGVGLGALLALRRIRERRSAQMVTRLHTARAELPWLLGAIVAGGVLISLAIWPDALGLLFRISAALMGLGASHRHKALTHTHAHYPDIHHRHPH